MTSTPENLTVNAGAQSSSAIASLVQYHSPTLEREETQRVELTIIVYRDFRHHSYSRALVAVCPNIDGNRGASFLAVRGFVRQSANILSVLT